jgi:hypothetical protein
VSGLHGLRVRLGVGGTPTAAVRPAVGGDQVHEVARSALDHLNGIGRNSRVGQDVREVVRAAPAYLLGLGVELCNDLVWEAEENITDATLAIPLPRQAVCDGAALL